MRARLARLDCCALCDGSGKQLRVVHTVRPLKLGYKMASPSHDHPLPQTEALKLFS